MGIGSQPAQILLVEPTEEFGHLENNIHRIIKTRRIESFFPHKDSEVMICFFSVSDIITN